MNTEGFEAGLVDVAPTVLALMGIPIPSGMDGRVIEEAVKPEALAPCDEAPKGLVPGSEEPSVPVYSLEEEMEIARRLADLGYL